MSSASDTPTRGNPAGAQALPLMGYVLLGSLTLFWGLNWPTMKIVLNEMPVWTFRSLCLIAGGGALLIIARLSGRSLRVPTSEIWPLVVCAIFNIVGWHLFSGYGVSLIESGRAAIIAFTLPVWVAVLGWLMLGERLTRTALIGLALGVIGLAVLMGPDLAHLGAAPMGALFMLIAAVSWAAGTVLIKRYTWSIPVGVLAGWQLLIGAVPVTIGAVLIDPLTNPLAMSGPALAALVYVLVMPMVFCHWAWFAVVRLFPAAIAAAGMLAIPVVGVLSGAIMLGEPLGWREVSALVLVCAALVFVMLIPAWRESARKAAQIKR